VGRLTASVWGSLRPGSRWGTHRRSPIPAGVLAFEEVAEESLLQGYPGDPVVGAELQAMELQPLPLRTGATVPLETAAGVEMVGPVAVGGREHGHGDLLR
jgi:hypothetical protein